MSRLSCSAAAALVAIACLHAAASDGQDARSTRVAPIVNYNADGFWLNLHHFLYVLGRTEGGMPDAKREAVASAPAEEAAGLSALTADEWRAWRRAVAAYKDGVSRLDAVFEPRLVTLTGALARAGDAPTLENVPAPPDVLANLRAVESIYRKVWWPEHRRANDQWVAQITPLVDHHGPAIVAFLTRIYGLPWPADGYPIHVSAYANWAGAYSTRGPLVVVSSRSSASAGVGGLELVFHEAMHQWDDPIAARLSEIAKASGTRVPPGLTHALIWMTAGEAVRRVIPDHVPFAESGGMWQRMPNAPLRQPLEDAWRPYLHGKGTRDQALAAVLRAVVK